MTHSVAIEPNVTPPPLVSTTCTPCITVCRHWAERCRTRGDGGCEAPLYGTMLPFGPAFSRPRSTGSRKGPYVTLRRDVLKQHTSRWIGVNGLGSARHEGEGATEEPTVASP